jgi:tetraacyldisaccharide 4'-kinase
VRNGIQLIHQQRGGPSLQLVPKVLWPLSLPYGLAASIRLLLYRHGWLKQEKLTARVISVGNITAGGTGKTPLVIYLAGKLKERNRKTAILTRGYKRESRQMVELTWESRTGIRWQDVGDEPYLLAKRLPDVPVMVGKNRFLCGKHAVEKFGSEILLLDDGFQHLKLFRDLDVVVIDSTNPFGNGRLLPAGILREPVSSLKRADLFVLTKTDQTSDKDELIHMLESANPRAPVVQSVYQPVGMTELFDGSLTDTEDLRSGKAFLFSGIGNPLSFEKTVKQLNVKILTHRIFPDHFRYKEKDSEELMVQAEASGADFIITTEKDSVRIPLVKRPGIPLYALRIDLKMTSGEQLLLDKVDGRK